MVGTGWTLIAGEQRPEHVESAIDDLTEDVDSNKDMYY